MRGVFKGKGIQFLCSSSCSPDRFLTKTVFSKLKHRLHKPVHYAAMNFGEALATSSIPTIMPAAAQNAGFPFFRVLGKILNQSIAICSKQQHALAMGSF